jgi:hypothetical protein
MEALHQASGLVVRVGKRAIVGSCDCGNNLVVAELVKEPIPVSSYLCPHMASPILWNDIELVRPDLGCFHADSCEGRIGAGSGRYASKGDGDVSFHGEEEASTVPIFEPRAEIREWAVCREHGQAAEIGGPGQGIAELFVIGDTD